MILAISLSFAPRSDGGRPLVLWGQLSVGSKAPLFPVSQDSLSRFVDLVLTRPCLALHFDNLKCIYGFLKVQNLYLNEGQNEKICRFFISKKLNGIEFGTHVC